MNFRNTTLINKNFISLILVVSFSLIIFFSNESKYINRVESFIIDFLTTIMYPQKWYNDLLIVKNENNILKQDLIQLNLLNAKLYNYKNENKKLREMLSFKESYSQISLIPANVVNHNFSSSPSSIIIDLGKENGTKINQSVIDLNGLIGKIINTGKRGSKVQIISDKNFAVSVKVGNEMQIAIFKPTHNKFGILEGVLKSVNIEKEDIIYTSGISDIYPPDLPVCKVLQVKNDADKPYLNVSVEILSDLSNLNYVFIIQ